MRSLDNFQPPPFDIFLILSRSQVGIFGRFAQAEVGGINASCRPWTSIGRRRGLPKPPDCIFFLDLFQIAGVPDLSIKFPFAGRLSLCVYYVALRRSAISNNVCAWSRWISAYLVRMALLGVGNTPQDVYAYVPPLTASKFLAISASVCPWSYSISSIF